MMVSQLFTATTLRLIDVISPLRSSFWVEECYCLVSTVSCIQSDVPLELPS